MSIEELLQQPIFTLPKDWRLSGETSYYHFIRKTTKTYLDLLQQVDSIAVAEQTQYVGHLGQLPYAQLVYQAAREVRNGIVLALQAHSNLGSSSKALDALKKHLDLPREQQLYSPAAHLTRLPLRESTVLYRLRSDDLPLQAREMFHIPYEKRFLVTHQRFSIAGQPCIYAASSLALAFKEIRAPRFGLNLHAVKLRANVESKYAPVILIDLRNQVEKVRARYLGRPHRYDSDLIKFLVTWPLVMASSIPTRPTDNFHEEYVIPHLLLEWVRSHQPKGAIRLDGVAFSSSRVTINDPLYTDAYNIVIPVHHWGNNGLCEVRTSQLQISAPITRAMLGEELPANLSAEEVCQRMQLALEQKEFLTLPPEERPKLTE